MTKNKVVDVLRIAPKPNIAAVDKINKPQTLPNDESTTLLVPKRILLDIDNKMAGPGLITATKATTIYKNHVEISISVNAISVYF